MSIPPAPWLVAVTLLVLAATPVATQTPPPQTPPPPAPITVTETIVVTARETMLIANAVRALKLSKDPFLETTVADNIVKLSDAIAADGRIYQIGPLTLQEQRVIDLDEALKRHADADGPIRLQARRQDSTPGPLVYRLTRSSFITLCSDIASSGAVRMTQTHDIKMIVVARIIRDLNAQIALIPEREIITGILRGFRDGDRRGTITGRVLGVADSLAASPRTFEFVPARLLEAFRRRTTMTADVFDPADVRLSNMVNVRFDDRLYVASVDHFVWFFLRFLLEDQRRDAPDNDHGVEFGGKLLDHLIAQLQAEVLDGVRAALAAPGVAGPQGTTLGDYRMTESVMLIMKNAPGVSRRPSAQGREYGSLFVTPGDAGKLPKLRVWLDRQSAAVQARILEQGR
jgi:hypothetical protein